MPVFSGSESDSYSLCVCAAIEYMLENYSEISSVRDVSNSVGSNYNTLRRNFRKETGYTLVQYLCMIRLAQACELLEDPELQVKEIAWKVGFNSESRFSQAFKDVYGRQPSMYRALLLSKSLSDNSNFFIL